MEFLFSSNPELPPHVMALAMGVLLATPLIILLRAALIFREGGVPEIRNRSVESVSLFLMLLALLCVIAISGILQMKFLLYHINKTEFIALIKTPPFSGGLERAQVFLRVYIVAGSVIGSLGTPRVPAAGFVAASLTMAACALMFVAPHGGKSAPLMWSISFAIFMAAVIFLHKHPIALVIWGWVLAMIISCHLAVPHGAILTAHCATYSFEAIAVALLFFTRYGWYMFVASFSEKAYVLPS